MSICVGRKKAGKGSNLLKLLNNGSNNQPIIIDDCSLQYYGLKDQKMMKEITNHFQHRHISFDVGPIIYQHTRLKKNPAR